MKKNLLIPVCISIISFIPFHGLSANFISHINHYETLNSQCIIFCSDPDLNLTVITTASNIDLHISYNGEEGTTGTFKIFNASDQLVSEFEIDLIKDPDYFSVLLTEYASGIYTIELTTSVGVHTSQFTI